MERRLSICPSIHKYLQLLLGNYTYDFDETLPQPSSQCMYQSLFMSLKKMGLKGFSVGVAPQNMYLLSSLKSHSFDET